MNVRASLFAVATLVPALALATTWEIDPAHSSASFAVKHMMVSTVRGDMGPVSGTFELNEKDFTKSQVTTTVDVKGINTREPKRDEHLRSPEFFDVAKYPTISFKSKKIEGNADKFKVVGDLTIRDVTKEVTLDVDASKEAKDPWGMIRRGGTATAKLDRQQFGLKWNKALETGGVLVGDEVTVTLDVELIKKSAGPNTAATGNKK